MLRASQISRICGNKPFFNPTNFMELKKKLDEKTQKKFGYSFTGSLDQRVTLLSTPGFKTDIEAFEKELLNKELVEKDPLPEGAMTYCEEVWLEEHYGFCDFSLKEDDIPLLKGSLMEDVCIDITSKHYGIPYIKNTTRKSIDFLTGECDVIYGNTIRDNKCPETWKTFRKKDGIEIPYKWQLVAYSILYGCNNLYLDYVLVNNPPIIVDMLTKYMSETEKEKFFKMEESIRKLTPAQRIKTYRYEGNLVEDQKFLLSRLEKAKEYYSTLTYEKCMKF